MTDADADFGTENLRADGGQSTDKAAICLTCGEKKPVYKFQTGDCTCNDCYDKGNGDVNYEVTDDGEVVEL